MEITISKYFIKVHVNKQPKNKLEEAVKDNLQQLDQTLWPGHDQVVEIVKRKFDDAVAGYTGRCTISKPACYEENGKTAFHIGSLVDGSWMYAVAYKVIEDNCIRDESQLDAADLERKALVYDKTQAVLVKAYAEEGEEGYDENIDLCWIGEKVAKIFGYF